MLTGLTVVVVVGVALKSVLRICSEDRNFHGDKAKGTNSAQQYFMLSLEL